jgi:subtilase family serine protease
MKKLLLLLMVLGIKNATAQTPRLPNTPPKKNELPLPKIDPSKTLKSDLIITLNSVGTVQLDTTRKIYFVEVNVTMSNQSNTTVLYNGSRKPSFTAFLSYFDEKQYINVEKFPDFDNPIMVIAPNESYTGTYYFHFKNLPTTKEFSSKLKLRIDNTNKVTEANESNNESEAFDVVFNPRIIYDEAVIVH